MKFYSVYDPEFRPYGRVLDGYDTKALVAAMQTIPMPASGTAYEPSIAALEDSGILAAMQDRAYGGMPVQIGMCWGCLLYTSYFSQVFKKVVGQLPADYRKTQK